MIFEMTPIGVVRNERTEATDDDWDRVNSSIELDLSVVWDRTQLPKAGADGVLPKRDDFRMVVAIGIEF